MSFTSHALTFAFATAVGVGGTAYVADRYVQHEMKTGQPCQVYKNVTKWMDYHSKDAKDADGNTIASVNYNETKTGDSMACAATAGEGQGQDVAKFVQRFKGLFQ